MYSKPIQQLISAFSKLPSVGERTAERYVFYLLKSGKKDVADLTLALKNLISTVKSCEICFDFSDSTPCTICKNKNRDQSTICVVTEPQDLQVIEKIGTYKGLYHVLRGTIKTENDSLDYLKIKQLFKRLETNTVKEVILAFNPDLEGETTMMYLKIKIRDLYPNIKITKLARGIPMGGDLKYADEITLGSAFKNRTAS